MVHGMNNTESLDEVPKVQKRFEVTERYHAWDSRHHLIPPGTNATPTLGQTRVASILQDEKKDTRRLCCCRGGERCAGLSMTGLRQSISVSMTVIGPRLRA